jgi:hypothetical protein
VNGGRCGNAGQCQREADSECKAHVPSDEQVLCRTGQRCALTSSCVQC